MQFNPFSLNRPDVLIETKTFTDKVNPEAELTLTLRAENDAAVDFQEREKSQEYIRDFVVGRDDGPPAPLPPVGGRAVKVTRTLCGVVATLESMQVPGEEEEPFSFSEWCALSVVMPSAFREIDDWAADLRERARGEKKVSPKETTAA